MHRTSQRQFPVLSELGGYLGMVSAGRLVVASAGSSVAGCSVETPALSADDDLEDAVGRMAETRAEAAAVLDGATVVGLLRMDDVARLLEDPRPLVGRRR